MSCSQAFTPCITRDGHVQEALPLVHKELRNVVSFHVSKNAYSTGLPHGRAFHNKKRLAINPYYE